MGRFEGNDFFKDIKRATINEAKRLMYVGMTRPKEQLILTTLKPKSKESKNNPAQWLLDIGCDAIDTQAAANVINWGGADWMYEVRDDIAPKQENVVTEAAKFTTLKQPTERQMFDDKFVSPSKVKTDKQLYGVEQCGTFADRIAAKAADGRDSTIGDFIHHLMCLWNGDSSIIGKLAQAYGVNVDMDAVAKSVVNFWNWMEQKYGKPTKIERESPFTFTNEMGQIVTGEIDLVYHTATGDVLVDYKTYQGKMADLTDENSNFYAGKYGGQLALYSEALSRNGNTIRDRLICYLSLGAVVSISPVDK